MSSAFRFPAVFLFLQLMLSSGPIGIFDSGFGGLTVFKSIREKLPRYDYIYLGDNARAPYGNRSYETVYEYTLECIKWFFKKGCPLVILACNTASARALRTIQKKDLALIAPENRVLGVIRPSAEVIGNYTESKHIGIMGTRGTVNSSSYLLELQKLFPELKVYQQACPMWVHLIEDGEYESEEADYFVKKYLRELLSQSEEIDTILLACTHYPLLMDKIKKYLPENIRIVGQGPIVAESLEDYLHRHPEMESRLTRQGNIRFYTTDDAADFNAHASVFFGQPVNATHVGLHEVS